MDELKFHQMTNEELKNLIIRLKKEKNAVVLVHNYQFLEVQDIADYIGDSLDLSQKAEQTDADIILFCGVKFMAETAKILSPEKKVLLSHKDAGCPMAEMITANELKKLKNQYGSNRKVVCYVNSTAEVKAESDICCTSANAVKIVNSFPKDQKFIFVPDKNLGSYTAMKTGRDILLWNGYCIVHDIITLENVNLARQKYPDYSLIVHPECKPEVYNAADAVGSTKQIEDYVDTHDKVIIGTEIGMYHKLQHKYPQKQLTPLSKKMVCQNMKKTKLVDVAMTLYYEQNEVIVPERIAKKAYQAVDRMLKLSQ